LPPLEATIGRSGLQEPSNTISDLLMSEMLAPLQSVFAALDRLNDSSSK
jgi:hypothetical protein